MSSTMLNTIFIVVIIIFIGAIVYSIYNASKVSKENQAKEEMHRQMLLAEIEGKRDNHAVVSPTEISCNNIDITESETETNTLNYDNVVDDNNMVDDIDDSAANGKRLRDFFDGD